MLLLWPIIVVRRGGWSGGGQQQHNTSAARDQRSMTHPSWVEIITTEPTQNTAYSEHENSIQISHLSRFSFCKPFMSWTSRIACAKARSPSRAFMAELVATLWCHVPPQHNKGTRAAAKTKRKNKQNKYLMKFITCSVLFSSTLRVCAIALAYSTPHCKLHCITRITSLTREVHTPHAAKTEGLTSAQM